MMTPTRPRVAFAAFALMLLGLCTLGGCTSTRHSYEGHSAQQVWTAMVAVAKTPDYSDGEYTKRWTVRENNVWVDEENKRIEIDRRLERYLHRPSTTALHQTRHYKFQIDMIEANPPQVSFVSRDVGVPAHAWDEADRYFAEVLAILEGQSSKPAEDEAEHAAPQPAKDDLS